MNRSILALVAASLLLSGCMHIRTGPTETVKVGERTVTVVGTDGFDAAAVNRPRPQAPNVFINAKEKIVADQEPIRPEETTESGTVTITWALDRDNPYIFPDDTAIEFLRETGSAPPAYACAVLRPRNKVIACTFEKPGTPQRWKYAIKVTNRTTGRPLTTLDPWVFID